MTNEQQTPDAELLDRFARSADDSALAQLVARYSSMVFQTAYRILRDTHEAEDALQATFVVLARKARTLKPEACLAAWLRGVARRAALEAVRTRIRRERRERQSMDTHSLPSDEDTEALRALLYQSLDAELARLSSNQRQAVILRYVQGYREREAADIAGCSVPAMNSRAFEGLEKLRKRLARTCPAVGVALVPLLEAESQAVVSPTLLSSVTEAALSAQAGALAAGDAKVQLLAKGVLKMMFWSKIKAVAAAAAAISVVSTAVAVAQSVTAAKQAPPAALAVAQGGTASATAEAENANRIECLGNLKQIGSALIMFAEDHAGRFPLENGGKGLDVLRKNNYLKDVNTYACPSTGAVIPDGAEITDANCAYVYRGGLTRNDPRQPIAWDKPGNHNDFVSVVFSDGHAEGMTGKDWLLLQKKWKLNE